MNMYDIIARKRDGGRLSGEMIDAFVSGYTDGAIPDYQASALLMAIYLRGLDREETYRLTDAMLRSGDVVDLHSIPGIKVDKHSTGGVGDKTTLIAAPLAAACGVPVAKMSGRGLGFSGGTVDKLESIPGFRTAVPEDRFLRLVRENGIAVIGQTAQIARADKKLYALRDVTATVENISLIASSIMSKKLASGSDAIILDVKCGAGAFMHEREQAVELAELMVDMGKRAGKRTIAAITAMDQPLGEAVGNALEVREAVRVLHGEGPADIGELSVLLAGLMVYAGGLADTPQDGRRKADQALHDGSGLEKLRAMILGQGGDDSVLAEPQKLAAAPLSRTVMAPRDGYIRHLFADRVGLASQRSGAGRVRKDDEPDLGAGVVLNHKIGDAVRCGEALAVIYSSSEEKLTAAAEELEQALDIGDEQPMQNPLLLQLIGA